jgi:ATPase subunit of ABC transporter with duplicated ATPase domains
MSFFKGNILFTSHDAELLDTVANRYIYINGSKVVDKEMAYDEFMELIEG